MARRKKKPARKVVLSHMTVARSKRTGRFVDKPRLKKRK